MIEGMFETASFHIVKPCNMKCKFCYATFNDMTVFAQLPYLAAMDILDKLKEAGLQKITFAGGEPMLYKHIERVIRHSKEIGLTTSIITNGSFLTTDFLSNMTETLDWIGISVDSINPETNTKAGRVNKINPNYFKLIEEIKSLQYKLKINTVVNAYNYNEDLNQFIEWADPERWKIFDTLKVKGQNDQSFDSIRPPEGGFSSFVRRHSHRSMVVESNEDMIGGYLLIDPIGRLFEDTKGEHTYSDPLQHSTVEKCLGQLNLKRDVFERRGGIYNW